MPYVSHDCLPTKQSSLKLLLFQTAAPFETEAIVSYRTAKQKLFSNISIKQQK